MARELQEINASGDLVELVLANRLQLNAQPSSPAHAKGQLFYDSNNNALSYHTDIPGVTLALSQESVARVFNGTGSSIPNATPVTVSGSVSGVPSITPAKADNFYNSRIGGMTTHAIGASEYGWATISGTVDGDFSIFSDGDILYLSDQIAGGMVVVAPDIASKVGMVLDASADGKMFINIENNRAFPTLIGYMRNGVGPASITTTPSDIANYTVGGSVAVDVDLPSGIIATPSTGIYRISVNFNITFDGIGNTPNTVSLELYNVTSGSFVEQIVGGLLKDSNSFSAYPSIPFDAVAGNQYKLRLSVDTASLSNVVYHVAAVDFTSIHIRA